MRKEFQNQLRLLKELPILQLSGLAALCLLVFSLPYELVSSSLSVGPFSLTNVEALAFLCILLALIIVIKERRWRQSGWIKVPSSWLILWAFFCLALLASTLFAPEFRQNALKANLRLFTGLGLAFALPQLIPEKRHLKLVIAALLGGGLISIAFGLAEIMLGQTYSWLNIFRTQPTAAGPFPRLSGSFNHANQAAMYIEATFPLLMVVVWKFRQNGNRLFTLLGVGAILLYLQASVSTFSRSSFTAIFLSTLIVATIIWFWLPTRRKMAYYWGITAALVLIFVGLNSWLSPVLRLRLSSEGDNEWYNASFVVPEQIEIEPDEILPVTVTVTNEGALHWSSEAEKPINLGGRWYRLSDDARSDREMRWTLDEDVAPGESLTMVALLVAPSREGEYEFEWDLVQEDVIWFSQKNGVQASSLVTVVSSAGGQQTEIEPDEFNSTRLTVQPIPSRRVLWSVAAQQFLERPLLGIGLDNFRLTYGSVMGWQNWNNSIHTNNWYIEMAVSLGILGSLPFFAWLTLLLKDMLQRVRNGRINLWQIALIGSLLAYLLHGLLDYFLMFNGTGLLFWILVGMWITFAWAKPSA